MAGLVNINQLRSISWGKAYLWDFIFPDAPSPFNDFFPATEVTEMLDNLESHSLNIYNTTVKFPIRRTVKDIKLTFIDDDKNTILGFFTKWMSNEIFKDNESHSSVATIEESSKLIQIQKLPQSRGDALLQSSYLVYPEGEISYKGTSESGGLIHQITLVVTAVITVGERGDNAKR